MMGEELDEQYTTMSPSIAWFSQQASHPQSVFHSLLHRQQFGELSSSSYTHQHMISTWQGSRYYMEKLALYGKLEGHEGCVNSVLFSDKGRWIFTGSDDTDVHIYDALSLSRKHTIQTAHTNNIFYAKELVSDFSSNDDVKEGDNSSEEEIGWIVTCAADGRVYCHHLPTGRNQLIYRHVGRAHRIAIVKQEIGQFITCGEDGKCCLFDIRDGMKTTFRHPHDNLEAATTRSRTLQQPVLTMNFKGKHKQHNASIYSVGINPMRSWEVALSGEHAAVCLFDQRFPSEPFAFLCPNQYISSKSAHVTGLKYTYDGQMLIASYNGDDIFSYQLKEHLRESLTPSAESNALFPSSQLHRSEVDHSIDLKSDAEVDVDVDVEDGKEASEEEDASLHMSRRRQIEHNHHQGYYQRYSGHKNSDTVKQVGLFGSKSEFVVSGSDCGHVFIWDIRSGELVKVVKADLVGAVNCLAAHPFLPILATSGLANDAKIWYPFGEHQPLTVGTAQYEKVQKILRKNRSSDQTSFRQRLMNPHSLRQLLYLLTGSPDGGLSIPNSDEEEEDMEEEDDADEGDGDEGDGPAGSRRAREDSDATDRPTRRRRGDPNVQDISDIIPLLRAALSRRRFAEEEDDDSNDGEESDDDADSEDEDLDNSEDGIEMDEDEDEEDEDGSEEDDDDDDEDNWVSYDEDEDDEDQSEEDVDVDGDEDSDSEEGLEVACEPVADPEDPTDPGDASNNEDVDATMEAEKEDGT